MTDYEINAIRYETLKPVINEMHGIEYAVVKGEALSLAAYGKLGCRTSNDVDILVDKADVYDIEKIILSQGFLPDIEEPHKARRTRIFMLANSHQTIPYAKRIKEIDVKVDVNFGILWGEYEGERIDIKHFLQGITEEVIHGVNVKVLSKEKTLIHLILHNYKDINSTYLLLRRKRPIYERVFEDIFRIVESCNEQQLSSFLNLSKDLLIDQYVFYMAYYTNKIFPCEKLSFIIEHLMSDKGIALLNAYGLCTSERHEWMCTFEERYNCIEMKDFILEQLRPEEIHKLKINGIYYKKVEALHE